MKEKLLVKDLILIGVLMAIMNFLIILNGNMIIPTINLFSVLLVISINLEKNLSPFRIIILKISYFYMILLFIFYITEFDSAINTVYRRTPANRQCYSNIRKISTAVELYGMDKGIAMKELDMDLLIKEGYLTPVTCTEKGVPPYKMLSSEQTDYPVYCLFHGPISWSNAIESERVNIYYQPMDRDIKAFLKSYKGCKINQDKGPEALIASRKEKKLKQCKYKLKLRILYIATILNMIMLLVTKLLVFSKHKNK